jgi:hypothetical protein
MTDVVSASNLNIVGFTKSLPEVDAIGMAQKRNKGGRHCFPEFDRLIRSIQRIEGSEDCFGKKLISCEQADCDWAEYCLKEKRRYSSSKEN